MWMLLLACAPPKAPERFEDMMAFGFENFDGDEASLQDLGDKLLPWIEANFEDTNEGYEISPLDPATINAVEPDVVVEDAIIGVVAGFDYDEDLDRTLVGITWPDQDEIFSAFVDFEREDLSDRDCFLTASCSEYYTYDDLHSNVGMGIELWNVYHTDFRRFELDDGTRVMVQRVRSPEPVEFSVDWVRVNQQYGFSYFYERDDGKVRRVQAMWADGEIINGDGDGYLSIAIMSMKKAAEDMNAWFEADGDK